MCITILHSSKEIDFKDFFLCQKYFASCARISIINMYERRNLGSHVLTSVLPLHCMIETTEGNRFLRMWHCFTKYLTYWKTSGFQIFMKALFIPQEPHSPYASECEASHHKASWFLMNNRRWQDLKMWDLVSLSSIVLITLLC